MKDAEEITLSPTAPESAGPDALAAALARCRADADATPLERARALAELELAAADGNGGRRRTLADVASFAERLRRLGVDGTAEEARGLVRDGMLQRTEVWRDDAAALAEAASAAELFEALLAGIELARESEDRGAEDEEIRARLRDGRDALREALRRKTAEGPESEERRDEWCEALIDVALEALTAPAAGAPGVEADRLRRAAGHLAWHARHVETKRSPRRRRLLRKRRRLAAEAQERELQERLEERFGTRAVARFERAVLLAIFLVLALLAIELTVTLPEDVVLWFEVVDTLACGVFLVDFFGKLTLVRGRVRWFVRHFLIDLVPSIPYGLLGHAGGDSARAGRVLRLLRLSRVSRYLRILRPVIRAVRALGFLSRGMDRVVRRHRAELNANVILCPNRAERRRLERRDGDARSRGETLAGELDEAWEQTLRAAEKAERDEVARQRLAVLRTIHVERPRSAGRRGRAVDAERTAVELLDALAVTSAEEIEERIGEDATARLARGVRLLAMRPFCWLPIFRRFVPRVEPSASGGEVLVAAAHKTARELRRHHRRALWFFDLHGTITPSELVDRVGSAMVKSSFRPAYRLMLFGGFYLVALVLLEISKLDLLQSLADVLERFVGATLVLLGSICFVILAFGWWLKRLAQEATSFFEQTASAQFLGLTEMIRSRTLDRDAAILERRVLAPEARVLHGCGDDAWSRGAFVARLRERMLDTPAGKIPDGERQTFERVVLLYRDYLNGALLGESDTRTSSQLVGNPAIARARDLSWRFGRPDRKELAALDLERGSGGLRGPYLWFSLVARAVARSSARLIVEYNRSCVPLAELAAASADERARFERWLAEHPARAGGAAAPRRTDETGSYATTEFTALHFLDDDAQRDAQIAEVFGDEVLELLRADRQLLVCRIFGAYPAHLLHRTERTLNLAELYDGWLAGGRVFLMPFRLALLAALWLGRGAVLVFRAAREIRHPRLRSSVEEIEGADFASAMRKIQRMRGPIVWNLMWLRARFDPEYLGLGIPGVPLAECETPTVEDDLRFIGAESAWRTQVLAERLRAELDLARLRRLEADGLFTHVAKHLGSLSESIGPELRRAAAVAYRADFEGIRSHLSARELLDETVERSKTDPTPNARSLPRPAAGRQFDSYWRKHGSGDASARRAAWRAVCADPTDVLPALTAWSTLGTEGARAEGERRLAELLRHPSRVSEMLVNLRAVQTISLLDVLAYREHVFRLGRYAELGDKPGDRLILDTDVQVAVP